MPKEAILQYHEADKLYIVLLSPWQSHQYTTGINGILGSKRGEEYWVLGDQFLQNYYSVYDFRN